MAEYEGVYDSMGRTALPIDDSDCFLMDQYRGEKRAKLRPVEMSDVAAYVISKIDPSIFPPVDPGGGTDPQPTATLVRYCKNFTITNAMIISKELDFGVNYWDGSQVQVTPIGGCLQHYNVDYIVVGSKIRWDMLGLETVLVAGSVVNISYMQG